MNRNHPITRRHIVVATAATTFGLGPWHGARAAEFPTRAVKVYTAFPAGSGPDVALRVVAEQLSKTWRQPVVVDNRPGGNGFIAIDAFRRSAADGHELIQLDSNHLTTHPHVFAKLPYDPQRDLEPVRPLFRNYFLVAVAAASPLKTIDDLIAAAKASPGKLYYGSWANGSPGHLGALMLQSQKGLAMTHVPYKEMSQLYTAVATRELDFALGSVGSAGPFERSGRLRFIAAAAPQRVDAYPQVAATSESSTGKGFEVASWTALFAPRGTPLAVRERISADMAQAIALPEVMERYRGFGYERFDAGPQALASVIDTETRAWAGIVQKAQLKLD